MPYSPTTWVDGTTPTNAVRMNNIENELVLLDGLPRIPTVVNGQWLKGVGGVPVWSAIAAGDVPDLSATYQALSQKAAANGYASLGADGRVPSAQLPALGGATLVTALPGSPTDGQEVILVDSLTAPTYSWRLLYVAAKASNRWVFVGGSRLSVAIATAESTGSTTYANLGTVGPSVTVPVTGNYQVSLGCRMQSTAATQSLFASYDTGGTAALDVDCVQTSLPASGYITYVSRDKVRIGLAAGIALVMKYRTTTGTPTFSERYIAIEPVAIGG